MLKRVSTQLNAGWQRGWRRWYVVLPMLLVLAGLAIPVGYLAGRTIQSGSDVWWQTVWHHKNIWLLIRTLGLAATVLVGVTLLALPLAWLTVRTDLPGRKVWTILAVLPLAVPGYLLAYTLQAVGGDYGMAVRWFDVYVPRIQGFWGSVLALSLYNMPYMFLNMKVAIGQANRSLEDAGRSLGYGPVRLFFAVLWPQMRPGFLAAGLVILLHVLGDFGVVSLMRFETYSYAMFLAYEGGHMATAACLGMMTLIVSAVFLIVEFRFLRQLRLDPVTATTPRAPRLIRLSTWAKTAWTMGLASWAFVGLVLPVLTIVLAYFQLTGPEQREVWDDWQKVSWDSVTVAIGVAVLSVVLIVPIVYGARRYRSKMLKTTESMTYLGYAIPPLAFSLGFVFFATGSFVYQTMAILIFALSIHFLAEVIGPMRSAMQIATPRLEEAARSLGLRRFQAFCRVTLVLLRPGMLVSGGLVFLSAMKELPITMILSPPGFSSLATKAWGLTQEAEYAKAAPFALTILVVSTIFVAVILKWDRKA